MRRGPRKPSWPFSLNPDCDQAKGLVGWWPGYPVGGPKTFDLSGRNNPMTLTNFASPRTRTSGWITGFENGSALVHDGTDDYTRGVTVVTTYPLTLMAWCNAYSLPAGANTESIVMALGNAGDSNEFWFAYFRNFASAPFIRAMSQASSGTNNRELDCALTFDLNRWHHIAATFTNSTTFAVYYDGTPLSGSYATAGAGTPSPAGIDSTFLGGLIYNTSSFYAPFNGAIEDARVYNRVLSANEIHDLVQVDGRWLLRWQASGMVVARGGFPKFGGVAPYHVRRARMMSSFPMEMG